MIKTSLPGGMIGDSAEMYSENNILMCIASKEIKPVIEVSRVRNKVFRHMVNRPAAHREIKKWIGDDEDEQINQYGQCLWGAFNMIPDIDESGELTSPEFIQCSKMESCKHKKFICQSFENKNDRSLSKAEERLIPLVLWSDRIIGVMLNLSEFTVKTHFKNIKQKLGLQTKAQLIDWAKDNGIELCK